MIHLLNAMADKNNLVALLTAAVGTQKQPLDAAHTEQLVSVNGHPQLSVYGVFRTICY